MEIQEQKRRCAQVDAIAASFATLREKIDAASLPDVSRLRFKECADDMSLTTL